MELLKAFIFCTLVMSTTYAFKLKENYGDAILKTFYMDTEDAYNGLKDYIMLNDENPNFHGNYPNRSLSTRTESFDAIVEIAIVCDKEWGDVFHHNYQEALKFWTAFFWDVNSQFQTLPSVNVTIRVTSVTVISSFEEQPFLEETRDENGAVSFNTAVRTFGDWIAREQEAGKVANYDIAVLATGTRTREGLAGIAYVGKACSKNRGVGIFINKGNFETLYASHEIAHILGASHDHINPWCNATGYIMEDARDKQNFFSWCSDVEISEYAKSDKGSCLRSIDEPNDPVIGQDFGGALPPTAQEQCKRKVHDPNAGIPEQELGKCIDVWCWRSPATGGAGFKIRLAENTACTYGIHGDEGRCFINKCRPVSWQLMNVDSNQCLLSGGGRFVGTDNATAIVESCPPQQTPLNSVARVAMNEGQNLMMAYASPDATDIGDKCFVYEEDQEEKLQLRFVKCLTGSGWSKGWTLKDVGSEQFLLEHTYTKKCVKQTGNEVTITENCDQNDKSMIWRFRK